MLPRVVWAEESKNRLRFEIKPSYDVVPTRSQLVTHGQSSCKQMWDVGFTNTKELVCQVCNGVKNKAKGYMYQKSITKNSTEHNGCMCHDLFTVALSVDKMLSLEGPFGRDIVKDKHMLMHFQYYIK